MDKTNKTINTSYKQNSTLKFLPCLVILREGNSILSYHCLPCRCMCSNKYMIVLFKFDDSLKFIHEKWGKNNRKTGVLKMFVFIFCVRFFENNTHHFSHYSLVHKRKPLKFLVHSLFLRMSFNWGLRVRPLARGPSIGRPLRWRVYDQKIKERVCLYLMLTPHCSLISWIWRTKTYLFLENIKLKGPTIACFWNISSSKGQQIPVSGRYQVQRAKCAPWWEL